MTLSSIDGNTQLVGVIGWPIKHSLSPAMHNAALDMLGLNWRYVAMRVHPKDVANAVRGLAALNFRGCNVTVPHKQAVIPTLDAIEAEAHILGAVNTLVFTREDKSIAHIAGHNTDVAGFIGALRAGGFEPAGRSIVIAGAGGAARGVVYGLLDANAAHIIVLNRTVERAEQLVRDLVQNLEPSSAAAHTVAALPLTAETLIDAVRNADLLVNTTTLGMWPNVEGCVWPTGTPLPAGLTVCDLVYNPLETRLLRLAQQSGAHTIHGLGMLARQGALALDLWVDTALDVEEVTALMQRVCEQNLAARK